MINAVSTTRETASIDIDAIYMISRRHSTFVQGLAALFCLLVPCIKAHNAFAQQNTGAIVRDPQAMSIVEQALSVLGGKTTLLKVRTATVRGNQQVQGDDTASPFSWEDDFSGSTREFRKELHLGASTHTLVSGHGAPAHQSDGRTMKLPPQAGWAMQPFHLPGILLARELGNDEYSIQLVTDPTFLHVRTVWALNRVTASVSVQDWYFDPATKLPVRIEYVAPGNHNAGHLQKGYLELGDFRPASGIMTPFRLVGHGPDQRTRVFTINAFEVNTTIDPTHFELNGGQQ